MSPDIHICISSPPDREALVAELFLADEQWAELNQEDGLTVELYPTRSGQPWRISFDDMMEALSEARRRLVG